MASEKTVDPDWQELYAIRSFVAGFKFRGKPVKVSDAHSLIEKETHIKTYLKSKWNLSQLNGFFLKYPHYFTLTADRKVYLRDPSLEVLEIDCALWFLQFMKARNNLPIHVTLAFSCVPPSIVTEYLKSKFNTDNMTPFFERHSDVFVVKFSYVFLRPTIHRASALPQAKVESNSQTPLSKRAQKRLNEKERKAVDFYVNLLKKLVFISTLHAHSFIGENQELHSYLRENYTISNLTTFFEKYPKIFTVYNSTVVLVPNQENGVPSSSSVNPISVSAVPSENTKKNQPAESLKSVSTEKIKQPQPEECVLQVEKRAVEFYKNLIAKRGPITAKHGHSFLGDNTEIREWLKKNYIYSNLKSFFLNHPQTFIVKDGLVHLVAMKSENTTQPQTGISKSSAPAKQKRSALKTEEERNAVDFYVKLLKTQVLISMLHALSFSHKEPELQSYLKETYSTNDLTTFFEKYPKIFTKYGSLVGLVSHEINPESSHSSVCTDLSNTNQAPPFVTTKVVFSSPDQDADDEELCKVAEKNQESPRVSCEDDNVPVTPVKEPPQAKPQSNLKYDYKEDQWSPLNPEGKKHYDRAFLLKMQSQPLSLIKPKGLPDYDIIKDNAMEFKLPKHGNRPAEPSLLTVHHSNQPDLMPSYACAGTPEPDLSNTNQAPPFVTTKVAISSPDPEADGEELCKVAEKNQESPRVSCEDDNVPVTLVKESPQAKPQSILKYDYKEDQWSPLNPEGKKYYERAFLLKMQSHPFSLIKPKGLPDLVIIKDNAMQFKLPKHGNRPAEPSLQTVHHSNQPDFMPSYACRGTPEPNFVSSVPSEDMKEPQQTQSLQTVSTEKIKQPQPEKSVLQGSSGRSTPSSSPVSTPILKSYTILRDGVKESSASRFAPCLLSKIMICTSSQQVATNGSSHEMFPLSRPEMFRDAACQTLSSGPILSLSVFDELEKAS